MNDIRTFTIDEFNKQMQQPTLHPEVAVIDPARLEDDGTLCFTGNFYAIRFVQTRCGEARYGRKCADFALYLPGWNCCWTTAFVSMNGNLPAAPTLTGNIWRSWTKRFPNIFHYADKSLWKAV